LSSRPISDRSCLTSFASLRAAEECETVGCDTNLSFPRSMAVMQA
jgi:hypothetical protein